MSGKCVNCLEAGSRVWSEHGLIQHGYEKVNVPAKTGGTVAPFRGGLYAVNWDSGQQSVHYPNELLSIGNARCLAEFLDSIKAAAARLKKVLGPLGGNRGITIFLRNGDWISADQHELRPLVESLEVTNIPVELEQLEKQKKVKPGEVEDLLRRIAGNAKRKK